MPSFHVLQQQLLSCMVDLAKLTAVQAVQAITFVIIDWSLGSPYINGILPPETVASVTDNPQNITDVDGHGGQDSVLSNTIPLNGRTAGEPNDLLPGDAILTSPDGAMLGALHGKDATIRGSSLAQINCYGEQDKVQIVSGQFRHITWMGESQYINDEGHTSYQWRGGSDQLTQTGIDEEHYTLFFDLGYTGDVCKFKVKTPRGQALFEFHVTAQGKLELNSIDGFNHTSGPSKILIDGTEFKETTGDLTQIVQGNVAQTFGANHTFTVSNNKQTIIGQDLVTFVNRDCTVNVGGQYTTQITGTTQIQTSQGTTTLKNTSSSTTIDSQTNVEIKSQTANIIATPGQNFNINTNRPDSINLGDNPSSHNTKFEELKTFILSLVQRIHTLETLLGSHTHVVTGTAAVFDPGLSAFAATPFDTSSLDLAKSMVVKTK
jgi:hypothetical protein